MNQTSIEWVKNPDGSQGYTWNPITGCLNHDNGLCKGGGFPCYAYKLANGRLKNVYMANGNIPPTNETGYRLAKGVLSPFYPRFWEERLYEPFFRRIPSGIFVCDMSDLFGNGIPNGWTSDVVEEIIPRSPQHRFYLLTKQPQNLIKFSPFPENCWVGVTATSRKMAWDAFWDGLIDTKAKIKYLSLEPLMDWSPLPKDPTNFTMKFIDECRAAGINWLIIGACTGTFQDMMRLCVTYPQHTLTSWGNKWTAQPPIEWVKEIVEAADKAGIPVFLKDNLKRLFEMGKIYPWATSSLGFLRQEMPKV